VVDFTAAFNLSKLTIHIRSDHRRTAQSENPTTSRGGYTHDEQMEHQ